MLAGGTDVAEKLDGLVEATDNDVDMAGIEDVAECRAPVCAGDLELRAGAGADILKFAVAEITENAFGSG